MHRPPLRLKRTTTVDSSETRNRTRACRARRAAPTRRSAAAPSSSTSTFSSVTGVVSSLVNGFWLSGTGVGVGAATRVHGRTVTVPFIVLGWTRQT